MVGWKNSAAFLAYLRTINSNGCDDMPFLKMPVLDGLLWLLVPAGLGLEALVYFWRSFGAGHSVSPLQPVS